MVDPTGIKYDADELIAKIIDYQVTSSVGSAGAVGSVWGFLVFDKASPSYIYSHPNLVHQCMVGYATRLCVDIHWVARAEPTAPPEQVYWDLTYAVRGDGESLDVYDYDPYQQSPVNAGDYTNSIKKRTRFNLQDVFTGNEGKMFACTIGRASTMAEDTFGGDVGLLGVYLMKRGEQE